MMLKSENVLCFLHSYTYNCEMKPINPDMHGMVVALLGMGHTQTQIAAAIGCSQPYVCMMNTAKKGVIKPTYRVAAALIAFAEKNGISPEGKKIRVKKNTVVAP